MGITALVWETSINLAVHFKGNYEVWFDFTMKISHHGIDIYFCFGYVRNIKYYTVNNIKKKIKKNILQDTELLGLEAEKMRGKNLFCYSVWPSRLGFVPGPEKNRKPGRVKKKRK